MEIALLESQGLPPGCLLSLKAGTTRRQAPADPSACRIRFAKGVPEGDLIKVDLLTTVGSAYIDPSKGGADGRHNVCFAKEGFQLTLKTSQELTDASQEPQGALPLGLGGLDLEGSPSRGDATPSRRHLTALSAKRFLDEHKLLSWAQALFHDLIRDEPADPWTYVDRHLASARRSSGANADAGGSSEPKKAEPLRDRIARATEELLTASREVSRLHAEKESAQASEVEQDLSALGRVVAGAGRDLSAQLDALEAQSEESTGLPSTHVVDAEELRSAAGAALAEASKDGRLRAALTTVRPGPTGGATAPLKGDEQASGAQDKLEDPAADSVEAMRESARDALVQSFRNGQLATIVASKSCNTTEEAMRLAARDALMQSHRSGKLAEIVASSSSRAGVEALRASAKHALVQSFRSGHLATIVASKSCDKTEAMRLAARDALMQSHRSGKLAEIVASSSSSKVGAENVEALRVAARDALVQSCKNGKLASVLVCPSSEDKMVTSAEELKEMAKNMLSQACRDGSLASVLESTKAEAEKLASEELRRKAGSTLVEASKNGTLEAAADVGFPEKSSIADLRQQACQSLLKAVHKGALEAALAAARGDAETETSADAESLRKLASDTLLQASKDGSLEAALTSLVGGGDDMNVDALRNLACETLMQASSDGSLATALRETRAEMQTGAADEGAVSELRAQAREALAAAARDGKLRAIVQDISLASAEGVARASAACQQAVEVLCRAYGNGRLEAALQGLEEGSNLLEMSQEMDVLHSTAHQEMAMLMEQAQEARRDVQDTYNEARQELAELRAQTREVQEQFQELMGTAKMLKELLASVSAATVAAAAPK
eukprot:TRINITY_DN5906_c0_g1_i1.p1 TRINITY_DN5906_c0_g1~~TRINITY_DN5906_c0_g1_i1.p1  ORF type:complete len:845 (-),score=215.26 TRINITY_DN5906_c0_g1_i1:451-2985(-)